MWRLPWIICRVKGSSTNRFDGYIYAALALACKHEASQDMPGGGRLFAGYFGTSVRPTLLVKYS